MPKIRVSEYELITTPEDDAVTIWLPAGARFLCMRDYRYEPSRAAMLTYIHDAEHSGPNEEHIFHLLRPGFYLKPPIAGNRLIYRGAIDMHKYPVYIFDEYKVTPDRLRILEQPDFSLYFTVPLAFAGERQHFPADEGGDGGSELLDIPAFLRRSTD